jgi:hypothetical protein
VALEKGTEEFMMFGDFFQLCKKYWKIENTEIYWDYVVKDFDKFVEKYREIPLCKGLTIAFIEEQERKSKQ